MKPVVVWVVSALVCAAAAAEPRAATGQIVSHQYEIGQELGFGSIARVVGEDDDTTYVTPDVIDRLKREAAAGKKGNGF